MLTKKYTSFKDFSEDALDIAFANDIKMTDRDYLIVDSFGNTLAYWDRERTIGFIAEEALYGMHGQREAVSH